MLAPNFIPRKFPELLSRSTIRGRPGRPSYGMTRSSVAQVAGTAIAIFPRHSSTRRQLDAVDEAPGVHSRGPSDVRAMPVALGDPRARAGRGRCEQLDE